MGAVTPILTAITLAGRTSHEHSQNPDVSLTTQDATCTSIFHRAITQTTDMTSPQFIGVIGAGTMGSGITQVSALAGLAIVMLDVDEQRLAHGREAVVNGLDRLVKKRKLSAADRDAALGRLRGTTDYAVLRTCDLIIEAADRRLDRRGGERVRETPRPDAGRGAFRDGGVPPRLQGSEVPACAAAAGEGRRRPPLAQVRPRFLHA